MSVQVTLPEPIEISVEEFKQTKGNYTEISGVYVLLGQNNRMLYVGKSINIKKRIEKHIIGYRDSERFFKDIVRIRMYLSKNQFYVEIYETYLINELMPEFNRDKSYFSAFVTEMSERTVELDLQVRELKEERESLIDLMQELDREDRDDDEESFGDSLSSVRLTQIQRRISALGEERRRVSRLLRTSAGVAANG